jgi:hypothetical protein
MEKLECMQPRQADKRKRKRTRNPLGDRSVNGIYQLEKTFVCILLATRCTQCFTQTQFNRDVEIFEFPSGYLTESVSAFDTLQYTHEEPHQ